MVLTGIVVLSVMAIQFWKAGSNTKTVKFTFSTHLQKLNTVK